MNYLDRLGAQIRERVPQGELPKEDTADLFRLYAVLLLAKGANVDTADVHNAWVAWMTGNDPHHEALLPVDELSKQVVAQDEPYVAAIRAVARQSPRRQRDV